MPQKTLHLDFLYLDLETCERCKTTDSSFDEALAALSGVFDLLGYSVNVNKVNITTRELAEQYRFLSSPTIRVNGVDICDEVKESCCTDCGDLCGDNVDCRVFAYEGQDYEHPPAALIADGILRALFGNIERQEKPYALPDNLKNYFIGRESIMKKMSIYEPAMCCETGICGVGVDPELLRISAVLSALNKNGVTVGRFNLNSAPMAFVNNKTINQYINEKGPDGLPAVMLDDEIIITGRYPTGEEFMSLLGVPASYLTETKEPQKDGGCCCSDGKCC